MVFSLININLGAYFLLLIFFDKNMLLNWQLQFWKQFIGNLIFVYLKRWHFHKLNVNDTRYVSVGLLTRSIICVCICAVCLQPIFLRSRTSVFWDKSLWTKNLKIHSFLSFCLNRILIRYGYLSMYSSQPRYLYEL